MRKLTLIVVMLFPITVLSIGEVWFQKQSPSSSLKLTKINFYFHDQVGTANATAATVAQANVQLAFIVNLLRRG